MITIQEILGTDSIAASRLTLNSNFLLVENEINDLENTFNINVVTGAMDVSQATSGQIKAKSLYSNQAVFPSSGTSTISLYGTGASAGGASFSGTVNSAQLAVSGTTTLNGVNASGAAVFGANVTVNSSGNATFNGGSIVGTTGWESHKNSKGASGATNAFLQPASGGGGITGTYSNPYALSFTENVIFANCGNVSSNTNDFGNATGFFFYVATGNGSIASSIPQGFRLTIVNTSSSAGFIATGVTGPAGSTYYTGFNTSNGGYDPVSITVPSYPYKTSVTLQWEERIGKTSAQQKGSWVVISTAGFTANDF